MIAADMMAGVLKNVAHQIAVSEELSKLINDRAAKEGGFLKLAKAAADRRINTERARVVLESICAYAEISGAPITPMTLALVSQNVLIFAMTEVQALEKVRALVVPKKRAVPEKVAVKMAIIRIRKIQHMAQDWNLLPVPVEGDRASIAEYLETMFKMTGGSNQRLCKEMLALLHREDMTDDALAEVLRIAQIEEIMNS